VSAENRKELAPSQRMRSSWPCRVGLGHYGRAGTGKTTLLNSILLILQAKKVRCCSARHGRAANDFPSDRRRGQDYPPPARSPVRSRRFARNEANPLDCDALVADEVSMIDVVLMANLLRALPAKASLLLVATSTNCLPWGLAWYCGM